ncbi:uncharacterized protein LOC133343708 [Lethenteron reissneri]|uniref:uncharacterized protein LOC133343708 n=1 Tax=Lethenteron reissneri TaxID=7753 RepID=UPI002AB7BD0A|nr:uncharacterized protein LOC133343708 [Lethenteron reissneri]
MERGPGSSPASLGEDGDTVTNTATTKTQIHHAQVQRVRAECASSAESAAGGVARGADRRVRERCNRARALAHGHALARGALARAGQGGAAETHPVRARSREFSIKETNFADGGLKLKIQSTAKIQGQQQQGQRQQQGQLSGQQARRRGITITIKPTNPPRASTGKTSSLSSSSSPPSSSAPSSSTSASCCASSGSVSCSGSSSRAVKSCAHGASVVSFTLGIQCVVPGRRYTHTCAALCMLLCYRLGGRPS